MTNDPSDKPREFWIEQFNGRVPPSFYAFKDKPNFNKLKLKLNETELIDNSEYFHVIEYSAFDQMKLKYEHAFKTFTKQVDELNEEADEQDKASMRKNLPKEMWDMFGLKTGMDS